MAPSQKPSPGGQTIASRALLALSVLGSGVAVYLLVVHRSLKHLGRFEGGLCSALDGFDCAKAAGSAYSELLGVPIAGLALGFYLAVALVLLTFRRWHEPRVGPPTVFLLYGLASLYSAALLLISVVQLGSLCLGCVALYAVNALGLLASWRLAKPSRGKWVGSFGPLLRERWMVAVGLVFLLTATAAAAAMRTRSGPQVDAMIAQEYNKQMPVALDLLHSPHAASKGPVGAPVVIVEFSDFQCPFCARLSESLLQLQAEFNDEVRVEFRHMPLPHHTHAAAAARAAICAQGQGQFWPLHDALFANGRHLNAESIGALAENVGLNGAEFLTCLQSDGAQAMLDDDLEAARRLELRASPSFFINGRLFVGAKPYETLQQLVQAAIYDARGVPVSTRR